MSSTVDVFLNIRRFDVSDNPEICSKQITLEKNLSYTSLKKEVRKICELKNDCDNKVIKLRNNDYILVPLSNLLQGNSPDNPFFLDVARIQCSSAKSNISLLQDAYLDAVRQKLHSMESRVTHAELLVPQLQWRRQAHMEQTVNTMYSRVAFLNRRIDELMPTEWKAKIPQTIS